MKRLAVITGAAIIAAFGILPCCLTHGTAAAVTSQKTTITTNLHIEGMTCGSCATAVKLVLKKTAGVVGSTVSYEEKRAVVTYDPSKTTPAKVAEAVASALSYKVNVEGARVKIPSTEPAASCSTPPAATATGKPIALNQYRLDALRSAFNKDADHVRVIALLSPTCPYCQKGQRVVQSVFEKHPNDERLRGFVVWLPMLPTDNQSTAGAQAGSFVDARVAQQWDGDRASGETFAKMLGLKREAWDVYLLYARGVTWTGDVPPSPTFWMHQLRADSGADQRVCLNPAVFLNMVAGLLGERKARA
jgi:mercuric ion binding protein